MIEETVGRGGEALVRVALPRAVDELFTYRVPEGLERPGPGCRVLVPFGRERLTGVVVGDAAADQVPATRLRAVEEVLDGRPVLPPELLQLAGFVADYYACALGEVLRAMHGGGPRARFVARLTDAGRLALGGAARGDRQRAVLESLEGTEGVVLDALSRRLRFRGVHAVARDLARRGWIELVEHLSTGPRGKVVEAWELVAAPGEADLRRAPARKDVVELLAGRREPATVAEIARLIGRSPDAVRRVVRTLRDSGHARPVDRRVRRTPAVPELTGPVRPRLLTDEQREALEDVVRLADAREFGVLLLEGVTGSGKTEVYLRALAATLERGRTGIYLVPEISITPLLMREVRRRFGARTAILHSGLSPGERHDERGRILDGEVDVVLGARSAVFAPLPRLGLIVVDEEHEASYKQDSVPRYHGRDVAVVRGRQQAVPVILGSATPSLETTENALSGRYRLRRLTRRAGGARPATVEIVDMRAEWEATRRGGSFSRALTDALRETIAEGRQALLLLNRRGWADFLLCRECGEPERCDDCSVTLTVHLGVRRLTCHYCGAWRGLPERCRRCEGTFLQQVGRGTERLEAELRELLPDVPVARLDRDVARRRGASASVLTAFERGETRVLLGTQMIAKGHDFPGVTLVGVLQADRQLYLPDFRAAERTFQLLVQVAGRAGRRHQAGHVIIQTYSPDHPALAFVAAQDHASFAAAEAHVRRALGYPPFAHLVGILVSGEDEAAVEERARRLGEELERAAEAGVRILGPVTAPIARIKGRHRWQLILRARGRKALNRAVRRALTRLPARDGVTVDVDVDPQSLL